MTDTRLVPCLVEYAPGDVRPYGFVPADIPGIDFEAEVEVAHPAPRQVSLLREVLPILCPATWFAKAH